MQSHGGHEGIGSAQTMTSQPDFASGCICVLQRIAQARVNAVGCVPEAAMNLDSAAAHDPVYHVDVDIADMIREIRQNAVGRCSSKHDDDSIIQRDQHAFRTGEVIHKDLDIFHSLVQ